MRTLAGRCLICRGAECAWFPAFWDLQVCIHLQVGATEASQAGVSGAQKLQHIVGAEMSVFENARVVKSIKFPIISCLF